MQDILTCAMGLDVHRDVVESTGIYRQPIYKMLEPHFDGEISILVVNVRHMKNAPGRKTDIRMRSGSLRCCAQGR